MIKKEIKEIKRLEEYTVEMICDLCKNKAEDPGNNWARKYRWDDIQETIVYLRTATTYSDGGGFGTKISFDICPDCFTTKLIPWLLAQGATATKEELDY